MTVNNIYGGEGADSTGVPTKMLTLNSSLRIGVYNPATFFGIHVSSTPINLIYSEIPIAIGQVIFLHMFNVVISLTSMKETKQRWIILDTLRLSFILASINIISDFSMQDLEYMI